ncbi:hypothetical protein QFZ78_005425 [Paenibacillus sp. V4I5]|nr:hypothetical protein [Paenibacillus sp. V4I5]
MSKKADLIVASEQGNNLKERKEAFKKEVESFTVLNIGDEQVLKQILQRLIQSIEVFEGGKIKINYNLSNPLPLVINVQFIELYLFFQVSLYTPHVWNIY